MFRFSLSKLVSLLLVSSLFVGCDHELSESSGKINEIQVITDELISESQKTAIDSISQTVSLDGLNEPFFESITFIKPDFSKIPSGKNLLIILNITSQVMKERFIDIFSNRVILTVQKNNSPLVIKKENLFYKDQAVWFVLYSSAAPIENFLKGKFLNLLENIRDDGIKISFNTEHKSEYEKALSDSVKSITGITIRIPLGFQAVTTVKSGSNLLFRRGVGTKTEEWIIIAELAQSQNLKDSTERANLRDKILEQMILYTDGSVMKTGKVIIDKSDINYFRGDWITSPYPMAGLYTAKILKTNGKTYFVEGGIYSPGRSKVLNLLRLENMLRAIR